MPGTHVERVAAWCLGIAGEGVGGHGSRMYFRDLADRLACGFEVLHERRQGQSRKALGLGTGATGRTERSFTQPGMMVGEG